MNRATAFAQAITLAVLLLPVCGETQQNPVGSTEAVAPPVKPVRPFILGETLTYDVTWQVFPAGTITTKIIRAGQTPDDPYEATATAQARGFVALLYTVQDVFHSFFDPNTLCSQRIAKSVREGRRHKDTQITFDRARRLAILDERDLAVQGSPAKHAENPIPDCVQDVISAFYYVRRQPFRVGEDIRLPINDGAKTADVRVNVQAIEKIKTALGERNAYRVEPTVFNGLLKRKGRMLIWFSDDDQHLPLRIKAIISVGTITADLRSVSKGAGFGVQ
jgi:hypothetical protein